MIDLDLGKVRITEALQDVQRFRAVVLIVPHDVEDDAGGCHLAAEAALERIVQPPGVAHLAAKAATAIKAACSPKSILWTIYLPPHIAIGA